MPKRLSPKPHEIVYNLLAHVHGRKCAHCGAPEPIQEALDARGSTVRLVRRLAIDHLDEDPNNWEPSNLQLLCQSCNSRKQRTFETFHRYHAPRDDRFGPSPAPPSNEPPPPLWLYARSPRVCGATETVRAQLDTHDAKPEFRANCLMELRFRSWLVETCAANLSISRAEAINAGAEASGCSPETARRYLAKLTSCIGPLVIVPGPLGPTVTIRSDPKEKKLSETD